MIDMLSSPLMPSEIITYGLVRYVSEALTFLLDYIIITFGSKLCRQTGESMCTKYWLTA